MSTRRCVARLTDGSRRCKNDAVQGSTVCRQHGAGTPQAEFTQGERKKLDGVLAGIGDKALESRHPIEHLLWELYEAAGNVEFWREKVRELKSEGESGGKNGRQIALALQQYNAERDRHTKIAKTCLDAGIAERQVRLAEQQAEDVARVISAVFDELDVPLTQAGPIIRKHLLKLKAG